MKILLVNPPFEDLPCTDKHISQPIGLAYIASELSKKHEVEILDAQISKGKQDKEPPGLELAEIVRYVKIVKPDIVGISCPFTTQASILHRLCSEIKKAIDVTIVVGGAYPSILPKKVLKDKNIDYIILGEAEFSFEKLTNIIENKRLDKIKEIDGVGYRDGKKITIIPKSSWIEDIDSLKFPSRELLPMEKYFSLKKKIRGYFSNKKWTTVITSRGCPFRCCFCTIHNIFGSSFRARSSENVVKELEELNKKGIRCINIEDDNFAFDLERAKKILKLIKEKGLIFDFYLPNGIRADMIDEELIVLMKDTGFKEINIGVESGSQEVLDKIVKKGLNLEDVERTVRLARKYGIKVCCFFMLGFPGEKKSDILKTLLFSIKLILLGADHLSFLIATPYPGTEMYETCKKEGYLVTNDFTRYTIHRPVIKTEDFRPFEIKFFQIFGNAISVASLIKNKMF